ncbi:flavin reductase family protein [Candidatus Gracilibacteria bacterium]|nr:flavin reductase family protein [Candidatus Gracilibacteria bacterium]
MSIDTREFRQTMGMFATGITVVIAQTSAETHGMTANSFTSVSLDPMLILVCIDRQAHMASVIVEAQRFSISVLGAEHEWLSRHFAGRVRDDSQVVFGALDGITTLHDAIAALACTIEQVLDGGDHIIVLARVDAIQRDDGTAEPLLYYRGRYRQIAPPETVEPAQQPTSQAAGVEHEELSTENRARVYRRQSGWMPP